MKNEEKEQRKNQRKTYKEAVFVLSKFVAAFWQSLALRRQHFRVYVFVRPDDTLVHLLPHHVLRLLIHKLLHRLADWAHQPLVLGDIFVDQSDGQCPAYQSVPSGHIIIIVFEHIVN